MAKNFIKEHGEDHEYLRRIAMSYASSSPDVSMAMVAEDYGISEGNVQTAIELCITNGWVTYQSSVQIRDKSDANQHTHYTEKKSRSGYVRKSRAQHKYDKLLIIRRRNIIRNSTDEQVRYCIDVYLKNPFMSNPWFLMGYSHPEMSGVLMKGIFLGIATEEERVRLRQIALDKARDVIHAERIANRLDIVESYARDRQALMDRVNDLQYQLENFTEVSKDPDYPYTRDELYELADEEQHFLEQFERDAIDTF